MNRLVAQKGVGYTISTILVWEGRVCSVWKSSSGSLRCFGLTGVTEEALEEIQETCHDLAAIIDGTEQRIQRPQDDDLQRQHDSGRRKAHTRKTILVTNEEGRIRMVAPSVPGSCHDLRATVESGIVAHIPEEVPFIGDTGFDGLQNYYPERNIATPHKARRNHPLLPDQKSANRKLNGMRIVIEHTLSRIKRFGALSAVFRHPLPLFVVLQPHLAFKWGHNPIWRLVQSTRRRGLAPENLPPWGTGKPCSTICGCSSDTPRSEAEWR